MPAEPSEWKQRWAAIEEILGAGTIRNQAELLQALRQRGFPVTQSSVSRDLRKMGAARLDGRYVLARDLAGPGTGLAAVMGFITSFSAAGPHLLVVRTSVGAAQSVGQAIDAAKWTEVVGTVAGDDTVFIAVSGRSHQTRLEARIAAHLKETAG